MIERDISCLSAVNWGSDILINPRPYRASAAATGAEAWLLAGRSELRPVLSFSIRLSQPEPGPSR